MPWSTLPYNQWLSEFNVCPLRMCHPGTPRYTCNASSCPLTWEWRKISSFHGWNEVGPLYINLFYFKRGYVSAFVIFCGVELTLKWLVMFLGDFVLCCCDALWICSFVSNNVGTIKDSRQGIDSGKQNSNRFEFMLRKPNGSRNLCSLFGIQFPMYWIPTNFGCLKVTLSSDKLNTKS